MSAIQPNQKILDLRQQQQTSSLLAFDQDGNPTLTSYSEIIAKNTSTWEQWKAKYQFYRGGYHKVITDKVLEIARQQVNISEQIFHQKPDTNHLLQGFRNCGCNIQVIEQERKCLTAALQSSQSAYHEAFSWWEKIIFKIISYAHSFFEMPFDPLKAVSLPLLACSFEIFIKDGFFETAFEKTTIFFNGKTIPVKISAFLDSNAESFSGYTSFAIQKEEEEERLLGKIKLGRAWKDSNGDTCREIDEHLSTPLTNRFLEAIDIEDLLDYDAFTKDFPIKHLLTQIAVEVFQHEEETTL
ncbi:MAG: hypothetical protein ACRDFB_05745, partial [Rhabdochlamydiaceae bacterium]